MPQLPSAMLTSSIERLGTRVVVEDRARAGRGRDDGVGRAAEVDGEGLVRPRERVAD